MQGLGFRVQVAGLGAKGAGLRVKNLLGFSGVPKLSRAAGIPATHTFQGPSKGACGLDKDYGSFCRALADTISARKVISLMKPDDAYYQVPADIC